MKDGTNVGKRFIVGRLFYTKKPPRRKYALDKPGKKFKKTLLEIYITKFK